MWDWMVIIVYLATIVGIAGVLTRSQYNIKDYYLAGKTIPWWQSGLSTMATQLGAISFVSAPAFVAIKTGGGLKWLAYEFGVPLGLILVMAVIIPILHRGYYVSIYEYLERRFDGATRSLVSALFQLGRGLATAVAVLAGGLILSTALSISTAAAIILLGLVTIIYDALGGIRVVILTDVLQMMIILAGVILCGGAALTVVGWEQAWSTLTPQRLTILDFHHWGGSPEGTYGFWPMVVGGIFLYASYYGCDQSQVQRELSVKDIDAVKKSLLVNALGRFPVVFLYCTMGVLVGAAVFSSESLAKMSAAMRMDSVTITQLLQNDPDRMVPLFILSHLPHGLIGFIFVAIMAALMSSLDSGLNSLSAVTIRDFYQKHFKPKGTDRHYLIASKICTLCWGIFCMAVALVFSQCTAATRDTTIVLINEVGSLLYGPILAAFVVGMLTTWGTARGIKAGVVTGILINIFLWLGTEISWLWWNVFGFLSTVVGCFLVSFWGYRKTKVFVALQRDTISFKRPIRDRWAGVYLMVGIYFFVIVVLCYTIQEYL